jgi:uncharacterized protein with von Willebrand factor type A (vWA) domain
MREIAARKRRAVAPQPIEMVSVAMGDDLARILPAELVLLALEATRYEFYRRRLEAGLLQYALEWREPVGRGSLVVCIDSSGSMAGQKDVKAKAVALGLLEIAMVQRRGFAAIFFGSRNDPMRTVRIPAGCRECAAEVLELATYFLGGGTDFELPLQAATQILEEEEWRRGDVVFITDGICEVSQSFLEKYRETKARKGFSTFSVLIDARDIGGTRSRQRVVVEAFSDRVFSSESIIDAERDDFPDEAGAAESLYGMF